MTSFSGHFWQPQWVELGCWKQGPTASHCKLHYKDNSQTSCLQIITLQRGAVLMSDSLRMQTALTHCLSGCVSVSLSLSLRLSLSVYTYTHTHTHTMWAMWSILRMPCVWLDGLLTNKQKPATEVSLNEIKAYTTLVFSILLCKKEKPSTYPRHTLFLNFCQRVKLPCMIEEMWASSEPISKTPALCLHISTLSAHQI